MQNKVIRWAVHNHIGVYWDGGVRLIGIYRWLWWAKIVAWWYVRFVNPFGLATVEPVTGTSHAEFIESSAEWIRVYKMAKRK